MLATDPDRADETHQALADCPDDLKPVMRAIFCYPTNVPVCHSGDVALYPIHLTAAVLQRRVRADDLLDMLADVGALCPTAAGEFEC